MIYHGILVIYFTKSVTTHNRSIMCVVILLLVTLKQQARAVHLQHWFCRLVNGVPNTDGTSWYTVSSSWSHTHHIFRNSWDSWLPDWYFSQGLNPPTSRDPYTIAYVAVYGFISLEGILSAGLMVCRARKYGYMHKWCYSFVHPSAYVTAWVLRFSIPCTSWPGGVGGGGVGPQNQQATDNLHLCVHVSIHTF